MAEISEGAAAIDAATPASRDRYVDFLRATSILVVVLGHWLIAIIYFDAGRVSGENALQVVPGLWLATWVLQVMPVFFFVGGFSNFVSFASAERRGGGYSEFLWGRVRRLMRPTAVFLGVWVLLAVVLEFVAGVAEDILRPVTQLLGRPLWFIGIYLIVIAFAPPMIRLHRRFRGWMVAALAAGAVLVDLSGQPSLGYLNFAFVWLLVHQLGFFYADGTFNRLSRRTFWGIASGGLLLLIALTTIGPYPGSMVGLSGERSNTNPPTVAILALTVWQIGLVMLLRPSITRWLERPRAWAVVVGMNVVIMTMFLWHQTAMLMATAILYPLGFPQPPGGSARWWALRPVWLVALALVLAALVAMFGRFERPSRIRRTRQRTHVSAWAATLGIGLVTVGMLGFAVGGFYGVVSPGGVELIVFGLNPLQNLIHLGVGTLLLTVPGRSALTASAAVCLVLGVIGAVQTPNFLAINQPSSFLLFGISALAAGRVVVPRW